MQDCHSTKETVSNAQASLGILPQQIIKCYRMFMRDVLLLTLEECMAIINQELIMKNLI